jgi:putative MATE family efflux protein
MQKKLDYSEIKQIWMLALPAMVEFGFQTLLQYVDLYMVGTLGVEATAIVGLCSQVQFLLRFPINGMAVGVLSAVAFEYGRKDSGKLHKLSLQSIYYGLAVGALFWVLSIVAGLSMPYFYNLEGTMREGFLQYFFISYSTTIFFTITVVSGSVMRAIGDMKSPMVVNGAVDVLNIILNFFLIYKTRTVQLFGLKFTIYGAGFGLSGAAIGTAISVAVGAAAMLLIMLKNSYTSIGGQSKSVDLSEQKRFLSISIPAAMTNIITGLGRLIFTSFISGMGSVMLAAHSIAYTVESLFYIPAVGMERAATTLAGNYYGENDQKRISSMAKSGAVLVIVVMAGMGFLLFLTGTGVSSLFTTENEIAALSGKALRIISLSEPLFGLSLLMQGILEGMGYTKKTFVWSSVSMWLFRVVICFAVTRLFAARLEYAWLCMMGDNIFRALSLSLVFVRRKK